MGECRRTDERLTPYVDDALPSSERAEVERHLDACPPCQRSAEQEKGGRALLRDCADRLRDTPLPPGLRTRCEALAREHSRVRTAASWRARLVPLTMIATVVILAGVAIASLATRRSDALLAAQLTADHVKCFKAFVPDPTSAQEVERRFATSYGWAMHVPPSSADAGVRLLGGRRCLYADGTVPHVMYETGQAERVSLFRLEGSTRADADLTSLGHRCRIWSRGGNTYVLVAPESASSSLTRVARYVEREAR
jgi:anti-sigma factor RsiW